jgi:glycosyltransferase involved in cell wall biosynthesis
MIAAARLAKAKRYDIIHVHWPIPHALMGWAARLAGKAKLVCSWHGAELRWTRSRWPIFRGFLRWVIRTADAHTVNSTHTETELQRLNPREVVRLPYGSTVHPPDTDLPAPGSVVPELLFVGRLVQRKGVHILLEALARIPDSVPLHLRIIGDGPLRSILEGQSRSLGLSDRVSFDGFVSDEALRDAYQRCSLFILPAVIDEKGDTEGLGVVLIEALAFGKPAIASGIGGITDVVIHGQTGLLVEPGDASALTEAITRLVSEPELVQRLGENARQRARDHFSWDAIIGQTVGLYQHVIARPPKHVP